MSSPKKLLAAPTVAPRIVIVDDDERYLSELTAYLRAHGCDVRGLTDGQEVEAAIVGFMPDLVVLDQRLGVTNGTQILREIRSWSNIPCIVVTAISDPMDRVVNLEIGADDEVEKSAPSRELLARIRAVLRRSTRSSTDGDVDTNSVAMRGWEFSIPLRELRRPDGSLLHLTTAEFNALQVLVSSGGKPVRRDVLCQRVFGRAHRPEDRSVDTIINKLRRKLEPGRESRSIQTVRPLGYLFTGFPGDE